MKPAEVVTHGLDNVTVVVIDDHGGHPCLSGTWLACDNEGCRILLRPCFALYHGRPDNRVEKGIHLFGGKTSDFFQLFFCQFGGAHGRKKLVCRVLRFDGICLFEHFNLFFHRNPMTFAEFHLGHGANRFPP